MTLAVNKTQDQTMYPTAVGGRTMGLYKQRFSETITYLIDYSQWLDDGDTISSSTFSVTPSTTPAVVIGGTTVQNGNQLLFQIDSGAENIRYIVTVEITTSTGQIKDDYFQLNIGTPPGDAQQSGVATALSAAQVAQYAAEAAKTGAETAQTGAQTARTGAEIAKTGAEAALASAVTAKTAAETAAAFSQTKAGEAQTAAASVATNAQIATNKAGEAWTYATAANQSATTAATKVTEAATSATAAAASATTAATKASDASTYAASAATSATTATTKANQAATSETNAAASAASAASRVSEVAASATAAANSAATAGTRASEATTAATNAAASASTATTKASEASTSATNAATSATNASNSATAAASSATSASGSATTATTKASEASTSANNAAASASTATTKASEASTSASNAATSATSAAGSASTATTKASEASASASSAATSASNASGSATAASSAQAAAESARDATLAAYDSFDDRYLGVKSSDPTVDNDGNPLVAGALYFSSTAGAMKVYTGSTWTAAYISGAGVLTGANNLSDLTSVSQARTNLGLGDSATKNVGTASGTVAAGDDSRITGAAQKANNLSDLASASSARSNLGLGTAATQDTTAFAAASHGHVIGDVTGLQTALDGKAASSHNHAIADVTGLQTALDGKAAASHTHVATDITDSTNAGRALLTAADAPAQRTALGLGTAATQDSTSFAAASHGHVISDVTGLQTALDGKQPIDADLIAIAALAGTSGLLKKTAADTWALDTSAYLTSVTKSDIGLGNVENTALSTWDGSTNITTLGTIATGTWGGATIAIAHGGTGATDASTARTNLGLAIGSNVQAYDADLDAIAALAGTSGLLKKTAANTWTLDTTSYLASSAIGSSVQAWDADLDTWATKTAPSGTVVGTTDTQTLSGKTLTNPTVTGYTESVFTLGTSGSIALSASSGTILSCSASAAVTFTDSISAGQSVVLMLGGGSTYTITWPTMTWVGPSGNSAPTLSAGNTLVFWKVGSTLYGAHVGKYA